jgi:hypothetical protein
MQVSTDLPRGDAAVHEYMEHRGEARLPMNVSAEADAAYVADKGLQQGPVILKSWPVGACSRCQGPVHDAPFTSSSESGQFCSRECRDEGRLIERRTMKLGRPRLTPKQRRESESNRREYQRDLMRARRDAALAKNCPQPIENTNVTEAILGQ